MNRGRDENQDRRATNRVFHTAPLSADAWLGIMGVAVFAFLIVELEKWLRSGRAGGRGASPE